MTVTRVEVVEHARHFTAVFEVDAPDGRWRVRLDGEGTPGLTASPCGAST